MRAHRARAVHGLVVHRDPAAPHGQPPRRSTSTTSRASQRSAAAARRSRRALHRAHATGASRTLRHVVGVGYGQTECAALATLNNGQELIDFPTLGRPARCRRWSSRSATRSGEALPDGEEGEVCVRGPMVMPGYWRRPEATAETITPGRWLRTGDIGRMDGGRLYLSSRKRDLILRGGENVYPVEIEKRHRGPSRRRGVSRSSASTIPSSARRSRRSSCRGRRDAIDVDELARVVRGAARVLQGPGALGGPRASRCRATPRARS